MLELQSQLNTTSSICHASHLGFLEFCRCYLVSKAPTCSATSQWRRRRRRSRGATSGGCRRARWSRRGCRGGWGRGSCRCSRGAWRCSRNSWSCEVNQTRSVLLWATRALMVHNTWPQDLLITWNTTHLLCFRSFYWPNEDKRSAQTTRTVPSYSNSYQRLVSWYGQIHST